MPSRELIYRISINTSDARRTAGNVRSVFERELRQITLGKLDTSALTAAVTEAQRLRVELEAAARAGQNVRPSAVRSPALPAGLPANDSFIFDGVDNAISQVKSLAASYIGLQGIIAAIDLSKLGTQALRTYASLNILSGGGKQAEEVLKAIQKASNGTVTEMEAAGIATQGFALKLARTPAEFEKLTRAAREITQVSPIINDVGEALTQLSLFASNEASFARADQLGLAVGEVKDRMAELRRENDALSGSQAKLLASVQLLDEKYGATLDTIEAQATGIERLRVAWEDARVSFATSDFGFVGELFSVDKFAGNLATAIEIASGNYTKMEAVIDSVGRSVQFLENKKDRYFFPEDTTDQIEQAKQRLDLYKKASDEVTRAIESGVPGAAKYQAVLDGISESASINGSFTDEQVVKLQELSEWYKQAALSVVSLTEAEKLRADNKISADQFEKTRQATIFEQQSTIEGALAGRAAKAAPTVGIEAAIATYKQQKALVDQAIQQLIDSGVNDQSEIAIRVAAIVDELTRPFDALEERVYNIDFSQLSTAFSSLDVGFVDFLPGIASARSELAALSEEIAYSGIATEEQAAQFEYLSMVAYSVGDATSQLGQVTAELGYEFLASNEYAAALVDQLYQAEASFRAGLISADVYAGVTAVLSGQLLTLAQSAGIATGAIYALNQSQADMASAGGLAIGGNIANRVQSQQGERARDHNRREMERFNKETERAAKAAAKHTETAARSAAKTLESGAKKAAKALESALRGVEGLFDPSQVNDKDIEAAKLGTYVDKADEYLRRLRDEVENGVDWADVSIDDARAALEKVGIKAGDSAQAILKQFEDAWGSSVLFSDKSNLSFINKEAVQLQQDLSDKAAQGEKNILEYFGVVVDDAIDAVTGGGGGASYTPPEITPPDLIDVDPITEGLQTGLDDVVARTGENIKQSLAGSEAAFFGGFDAYLGGNKAGAKRDFIGPMPKEITITADASAQALTPYLSTVTQGPATAPLPAVIAPTIDAVAFQAEINKLQGEITVTLPDDAAQTIAFALGNQLATQIETFKSQGAVIGQIIKGGIGQAVALGAKGEVQIDIAGYVAGNLAAQAETFKAQGKGIATLLQSGIQEGFVGGEQSATVAVTTQLSTTIEEIQLFNAYIKANVKPSVSVALELEQPAQQGEGQSANAITPLLTNINTQIRSSTEGIKREGATVAQILIAGMIAHFQAGQAASGGGEGGEGGGTPFADALMTNLSTQFTNTSNMFYAVGFIPAGHVEDGFKGYAYEGLADSFMTKLTTEIRSNADNLGQRGGTMAGYVQSGFVTAFSSETFKAQLIAIGELMYSYLEIGILARVNGGALTNAIAAKVVEDITVELEQP